MVPDSAIELTGFSVHSSERAKELTVKSRGRGVCFYINNSWCNERNIHSICQDIYSITRLEVFRTTFIEAFVGLQVSSDAQTGTVRIIPKNDLLLSSRER